MFIGSPAGLGLRILLTLFPRPGRGGRAGRGRGGSGSTQTQWLGNGRRKVCSPFGAAANILTLACGQWAGGQSSWGGCCALLASWHGAISRAYCGTTSLNPGPWRFSLWPSLRQTLRAYEEAAWVRRRCLLPVPVWHWTDRTVLAC
jgi:hypothetical protein